MRFAPLLLAVVCALVLFVGLEAYALIDVREARDAEVARELVIGAEVLTPLLGREPLFEKPVLAYAPEAAARFLGGSFDVRSRQLRALAAALLVVLAASIGAQHFGARAGWFSGLALATSFGLPLAARTDGTQVFATLLGWVGCAAFADALFGRSAGRDLRLLVGWVALAGALNAAGPWPALWPLLGVALYIHLARDADGWRRIRILPGLVLLLGSALPWYGAMTERHGAAFLGHVPFFPYATGVRITWYAGSVSTVSFLVVDLFPWCALLPPAIHHAATWWRAPRGARPRSEPGIEAAAAPPLPGPSVDRAPFLVPDPARASEPRRPARESMTRERREESAAHFFIASLIAALVPIAIYPGAPLPAALPALPAGALLCGRFLDHLFEDPARVARSFARAALMAALLGTALALLAAAAASRLPDVAVELRRVATLVFVASWLPFLACWLHRPRLAAALLLLPVALGTPIVALRLLPALDGFLSARSIARTMDTASPPLAPLVLLDPAPASLRLYGRRNLVPADSLAETLERCRTSDGAAWVAFKPQRRGEVERTAGGALEILARSPNLVLARVAGR